MSPAPTTVTMEQQNMTTIKLINIILLDYINPVQYSELQKAGTEQQWMSHNSECHNNKDLEGLWKQMGSEQTLGNPGKLSAKRGRDGRVQQLDRIMQNWPAALACGRGQAVIREGACRQGGIYRTSRGSGKVRQWTGGRGWEFADRERSTEHHGVQGRSGSKQRESLLTG